MGKVLCHGFNCQPHMVGTQTVTDSLQEWGLRASGEGVGDREGQHVERGRGEGVTKAFIGKGLGKMMIMILLGFRADIRIIPLISLQT